MKSLCFLVIAGLAAPALALTQPFDLGPIASSGSYGFVPEKYPKLTDRDIRFGLAVRFIIEQFRPFMSKGAGNIPPLDPLFIKHPEPSQFKDKDLSGEIFFTNFTLKGGKDFKLQQFETRLDNGRVDYAFDVPVFYVEGIEALMIEHVRNVLWASINFNEGFVEVTLLVDYTAYVNVDRTKNFFTGHASYTLEGVKVKGDFAIDGKPKDAPPEQQKLEVGGFYYELTTDNVSYNVKNYHFFNSTSPRSRRSNHEASEVTKAVARGVAKVTSQSVVNTIVKFTNGILNDYTKAQALAIA